MPMIIVDVPFKFAHGGFAIEEFEPGEDPIETTDECAEVAVAERWARLAGQAEPEPKAIEAATENRAAAARRSNKARG